MDIMHHFISLILHLDEHLVSFVSQYGVWVYGLLFFIIFCETGLVVTAFLPGDSLLFAAGAIAAHSPDVFNIHVLFVLLFIASVLGNSLNYYIGKFLGPKVFHSADSRLLNKKYLEKAHQFYETYGAKTIIIARFMPIIRTFAPFIAGIGYMKPRQFFLYNVVGALLWVGTLLYVSYLFGNLPFVKEHFSTIVLAIVAISLLPPLIEIIRQRCLKLSA
ncbi:MAG: DedA family protein [Gammaproteobacteria bacterium]|nr:DedA family protein [Gammaproteobacteria bacterium]